MITFCLKSKGIKFNNSMKNYLARKNKEKIKIDTRFKLSKIHKILKNL